jgi:phosphatidylglycerophosphate synthase
MAPAADPQAYRAEDRALLLGFYRWLLWDRLVAVLPARLPPNVITVFGEACAILSAVTSYYASRGTPWLYLVSAGLLFIYLTGDNCDGPHARRTQQTSNLGEFLDHGLDGLASCAVLLWSSFPLHLGGMWLAGIAGLAGIGFFCTFWAQFRTDFLVTPQISAMEGVTGAAVFQILVFALGEPAWLRLSPHEITPATVVVGVLVLAYGIAIVAPLVRVARTGRSLLEVVPVALLVAVIAASALGPIGGLVPTLALSLVIAELVCRMLAYRHQGELQGAVRPGHAWLAVPWLAMYVVSADHANQLAYAGLAMAAGNYLLSFMAGCIVLRVLS